MLDELKMIDELCDFLAELVNHKSGTNLSPGAILVSLGAAQLTADYGAAAAVEIIEDLTAYMLEYDAEMGIEKAPAGDSEGCH